MSAAMENERAASTLDAARALREALRLAAAGYQLAPVTLTRRSDGKKGVKFHKNWRHESSWSTDPERIRDWSVQYACSFAIRTGHAGGVDVIDLDGDEGIRWWSEQGLPITEMLTDTISGGMHLFVPACGLPTVSKQFAPNVDTRGDGGLVFAPGSFIVGEEGTYSLRGRLVPVAELEPLPAELTNAIRDAQPEKADHATDGRITVHDRQWMLDKARAAVDKVAEMPLHTDGSVFRDAQMGAAMILGRLADAGLCSVDAARADLEQATLKVWPDGLSEADEKNIDSGLADGPRKERWRVGNPLGDGPSGEGEAGADPEDVHAQAVSKELARMRAQREARQLLDAELADDLTWWGIHDLLGSEMPKPLLPDFCYLDTLSRVFGPAGQGKSFVILDAALRICLGMEWCGRQISKGPVVYIAAEGQAVTHARVRAWMAHHKVNAEQLDGQFIIVPHAVMMTVAGVRKFLTQVSELKPVLVIVDTKNACVPVDEDSAGEFATTRKVLDSIRATSRCCVLLVDHTGYNNVDRARGSSAVEAAMDTEIKVTKDGALLTVEVTRDKAAEKGTTVTLKLQEQHPAAVVLPTDPDPVMANAVRTFREAERWWLADIPFNINDAIKGRGRAAALDIVKVLLFVDDEHGVLKTDVQRAIAKQTKHDSGTLSRAWALLDQADITIEGRTPSMRLIAPKWLENDE